jgi:hypothetical protein
MEELIEAIHRARQLTGDLYRNVDPWRCWSTSQDQALGRDQSTGKTCLHHEAYRDMSAGRRRPFGQYDTARLCVACRAYWYAEMCSQALERIRVVKEQEAAQAQQTGG